MARLLKVSWSGFDARRKRPASERDVANAALTAVIKAVHHDSRGTYGARRIHAEPIDEDEVRVARHRVARPMRREGLQGVHRSSHKPLTVHRGRLTPLSVLRRVLQARFQRSMLLDHASAYRDLIVC